MDVLVVVDGADVPERLAARARRRVDVSIDSRPIRSRRRHRRAAGPHPPLGRRRRPRDGRGRRRGLATARQLHRAGLPVTVFSDRFERRRGRHRRRPDHRPRPAHRRGRFAARPDRQHPPGPPGPHRRATCPGSCSPSSSSSTPAAASRTARPWPWSKRPSGTGCSTRAAPSSSRPRATPGWAWPSSPLAAATAASSPCPTRSPGRRSPCCGPTAPRSWSARPRSTRTTPTPTTRWPAA